MTFDDLDKGSKSSVHIHLYEAEVEVLSEFCARFNCSRSAAVGALLREYRGHDLAGKIDDRSRPGPKPRGLE